MEKDKSAPLQREVVEQEASLLDSEELDRGLLELYRQEREGRRPAPTSEER
jgi:hypothetical protein